MAETIESIFDDIGGFGLAQCIVILLIFYPHIVASWGMMQMAFAAKIPSWFCTEIESHDSHPEQQLRHLYHDNQSDLAKTCSLNGSDCSSFRFAGSERTIINEWALVCTNKWIPSFMISIQMAGVLVGAVVAGQISERWGRRNSLVLASAWHTCANFVAFFAPNWQTFTACRFLIGSGIGGIYTISFPYTMEFIPLKRRGGFAIFPFWTFGVAIFVGAAYFLSHWRYLHLALALFSLPTSALLFLVPESVRWLTVEGRIDDAMSAVERMAHWNKKPVPPCTREVLEMIYLKRKNDSKAIKKYSYLDLFKQAYFVRCCLVQGFVWATISMISYGIIFGTHGLAGNLYLNILLTNSVEIPGLLPVLWMMDRIGRKGATVIVFSVIFITTIVALVINLTAPEYNSHATFWFAMINKLCVDNVWNVLQAWVSELFPTTTRALGYGVAMTSARIGGMLAPFFINLVWLFKLNCILKSRFFRTLNKLCRYK
ncbi:solute carrier family 22 member 21 [Elysia marginata]|uniref:Solute carrier family 22 member 21 n=1 Tax=Elysia marginata TaxID=1093978 RepID=A0AAV4HVL0_9GAST|nr:solute carrier family 22 member 21 [Elysia marginata]